MNVNIAYIFYLLVLITLFNLCASKKSGLYQNQSQNQVDSDSEGEYNNNNNNEEYIAQQNNEKKSALYGNQQQYQEVDDSTTYEDNNANVQDSIDNNEELKTRHQFKYSFKKPYYYYNDTNIIPNWKIKGDVIPANDMIRLVPSVPNKRGSIWGDLQNQFNDWQIVLSFRIFGRSLSGSEGMALFYTDKQLNVDSFYGGEHKFNGLAIIFDSTNKDLNSNIPTINVLYNDGNTVIQSQKEYNDIRKSLCVADFRNSPLPVFVRITYLNKYLKVEVDLSHEGNEYYECTNEKIELPNDYYFGLGAKTGDGVPDDHDILSFDFYQLNPPPKENYKYRPKEEEIIEREGEYHIDDETLEHIKRVNEQLVKEKISKEGPKEKVVDAQTVQLTQFRTLETVNRILSLIQSQKYSRETSNQNEYIDDLNNKSEQLISDINVVYETLETLKNSVETLNDSVERNSQKNDYKINSVESKLNQKLSSEFNKVLNELRNVKEENRKLKETTQNLTKETKNQPNVWLVVIVSFFLNMIGLYIIVRVLPSSNGNIDLFKTHNY
ncbi:concanavalin A-like lectin/glucanase [Piromyces finnis]|uniref:Concanavalin A-like lectin/glucanase n=1 Tax=Piromyces finnis TaxID=1754191 RepID=A0A1Y1VIW7_9FUNG|nr:concanavalin A-like lectin/glucanase [Piromyces finnis]|eukprot:ORX57344.1 concanavalin A-like lectin/glucanase [Piromyces finnis]